MRVLGVLAAWGVLAVLGTMCFALGGSLGYRRGVKDTLTQLRERRTGHAGCRPLPANHLRRRTSGHTRPGARARRARWRRPHVGTTLAGPTRAAAPARSDPRVVALSATIAAIVLIGVPGTAIGATTAQPGESLYTVRRGLENVRVALAAGPEDDTEVHVELAAARLVDLEGLIGDGAAPDIVTDVSLNLASHAGAATSRLTAVADPTHRSTLGARLKHVTSKQVEVMDELVNDCDGADDGDCHALNQTLEGTVALQETTEHDVAVSDPPETVVQADKDGVVTAAAVDARATDDTVAVTDPDARDGDGAGAADPGTGDEVSAPAAAGATASTAPKDTASSKPSAKLSAKPSSKPSAKPSPAPSTTSSPTPSSSPAPTAPTAGSPATEPEVPARDKDGDNGAAGAASDAAGQ